MLKIKLTAFLMPESVACSNFYVKSMAKGLRRGDGRGEEGVERDPVKTCNQ